MAALLSPLGRWIVGVALVLAALAGLYGLGHRNGAAAADARWDAAMAAEQTRQASARAKALDAAVARELTRAAENEALEQQVDDYEKELATRPADARCVLDRDDVDRLRKLQGDAAR
ncbi:hypothetical protein SAMN02745157_1550 [Kaistia soli DSM 19436]|uniref:Uncharacterized protein n=1 Tax=Kaistia soli DSM 19436 TaxID=1122133 RepID=A0A1M4YL30_9HYPH|nr:hypothetical protein [Kaistia soli]SHF06357.1 hypothetical protein SAMN02745157_1550 [Kaistia soli DSM 19436]